MKQLLIVMYFTCSLLTIYAQSSEIITFQQNHPEIEFISQETFNNLSLDEIKLLGNHFILFNQNIESSDLSKFETNSKKENNSTEQNKIKSTEEDNLQIKIWKKNHQDVKIVKRSEFEALSPQDQINYTNFKCMILIGETITIQDILNYPF